MESIQCTMESFQGRLLWKVFNGLWKVFEEREPFYLTLTGGVEVEAAVFVLVAGVVAVARPAGVVRLHTAPFTRRDVHVWGGGWWLCAGAR